MADPRKIRDPSSEEFHSAGALENTPLVPDPRTSPQPQWQDHQDEYTPLLAPASATSADCSDGQWDDAVLKGLIDTTWKRETKLLTRSAAPLVLTFVLQYSLTVASIFTVGHIGKVELGAVSLAHSTPTLADRPR
jgi:hypothetical protein